MFAVRVDQSIVVELFFIITKEYILRQLAAARMLKMFAQLLVAKGSLRGGGTSGFYGIVLAPL